MTEEEKDFEILGKNFLQLDFRSRSVGETQPILYSLVLIPLKESELK